MKKTLKKYGDTIFLIINLSFSILTMALVFTFAGHALKEVIDKALLFLALSIGSIIIYQIFLFIVYKNKNDRIRLAVVGLVFVIAMVFSIVSKNNYVFYYLTTFSILLALALSQFLIIFFHNKERSRISLLTNALFSLVLLGLGVSVLIGMNPEKYKVMLIIDVIILLFFSMKNILTPTIRFAKIKIFVDILAKTHTLDVLLCLLAMIIGFSFLFPMFEPGITDYWDAMWYCFAVITTIGFGDFYAVTVIGRVLTVFLGIYGIVTVAILTSVIVNYYNAVSSEKNKEDKYIE